MTPPSAHLTEPDLAAVADVMARAGVELVGPLTATPILGGRSNLTFLIDDGESRWVLRMAPRAGRTPSAHDVAREYRVTRALGPSAVPVPPVVALCEDESLIGSPFAVSEFVDGHTVQTRDGLDRFDGAAVSTLADRLVETLAALHRIDHVAVGLERFGRPDAYAERQVKRWTAQWELVGTDRPRSLADALSTRLGAAIPEQQSTGIVHGDYRIDNTLLRFDPSSGPWIAAVVDWELSTIGDPVADVAMMCAYRHPAFDLIVGAPSAWTSPRLPDASGLAAAYESAGGVSLANWSFQLSLAYFKIAVIAAGIDHRYREGAGSGPGVDTAGESVATYLELGLASLDDCS